jgi:hypothetical protein
MDEGEPRPRRRGYFLHSDTTGEIDHNAEYDNPEGVVIRIPRQSPAFRQGDHRPVPQLAPNGKQASEIRSGSVTGSRQRAHSHR